jgi:hypothetical protein
MAYIGALIAFLVLSSICWFVAISLDSSTVNDHTLPESPDYRTIAITGIVLHTITCFLPFPVGFILGSLAWLVTAASLSLSRVRQALLFAYLLAGSIVERLMVLGILEALK